jgi:Flp pilus assembly protein TadG
MRAAFGREDGAQALVEFAFVLPVLLLLILGLFDVARAVMQENTLAFAAREGTRYAIVHGSGASSPVGYCGATTTSTTIVAPGAATVTPLSMTGIAVDTDILADTTGSLETVTVTSTTATTFTATFGKSHTGTWTLTAGCTNSTITGIVQDNAIGVPSVTVKMGFPDGDNDRGSRVWVDATAPFVPLPSQYLLNGALSINLRGGSMLVIQR